MALNVRVPEPLPTGRMVPNTSRTGAVAIQPNLPVPGISNVSGVRRVNPFRKPDVVPAGRFNGALGTRPNSQVTGARSPGKIPYRHRDPSGAPEDPTNTAPLSVIRSDPRAVHAQRFPLIPAVGSFRPFQGIPTLVHGEVGGAPNRLPLPLLAGLKMPGPLSRDGGATEPRNLKNWIAAFQRNLKVPIRLTAGIGGEDLAQGLRIVPDLPDRLRETIRDIKPKAWRGVLAQQSVAPYQSVRKLALGSVLSEVAPPVAGPASGSIPNPVAPQSSAPISIGGGGEPAEDAAPSAGPTAPSSSLGLIAVAAIAALVLFR